MNGELKDTAARLQTALGKVEEFGAKGLTPEQLRKYHYAFGMEYFDELNEFVKYGSHEEAVKAVEAGLVRPSRDLDSLGRAAMARLSSGTSS